MIEVSAVHQITVLIFTVTVPTAGLCYFVIKLTIKGAMSDFLSELRKEFVNQGICVKNHDLDNERFNTINEKLDRFEKQLDFFLNKKREI